MPRGRPIVLSHDRAHYETIVLTMRDLTLAHAAKEDKKRIREDAKELLRPCKLAPEEMVPPA